VTVLGSLVVNGVGEVELLDNDTGAEVEVLADNLDELFRRLIRGTVVLNEEGERLGNTNGVRELDEGAAGETSVDQRLCNPASEVSGRAIDLGVVLSGEGTTTVGTPTTVSVNDNLAASETGITLGTTDDEETRGLDVVDGLVVQVLCGDDLLDNLVENLLAELLGGNVGAVLGRDDNSVDTLGDNGTAVVLVLDGDLGLGVGSQPGEGAVVSGLGHGGVESVGELDGEGEELGCLVGGITWWNED
jgi:hypothetical protein